jgi:hypothetical protein
MSKRSKARKSGEYVGGRPWPAVCPKCRYCGGVPPKLFYRARGLCNICYKEIKNTDEIDEYEPLPEVCSDISLRSLQKNPRKWLQKEMGRSHADGFAEASVAEEAMRIFQLAVSRWYGEETPPVSSYEPVAVEDVIWSNPEADPGPMSIEDAINIKNATKSKAAIKKRNLAIAFRREVGSATHSLIRGTLPSVRKPKISCLGGSATATWGLGKVYVSVTSMGDDVFIVLEREDCVILEEDFKLSRVPYILNAALNIQKVDRTS